MIPVSSHPLSNPIHKRPVFFNNNPPVLPLFAQPPVILSGRAGGRRENQEGWVAITLASSLPGWGCYPDTGDSSWRGWVWRQAELPKPKNGFVREGEQRDAGKWCAQRRFLLLAATRENCSCGFSRCTLIGWKNKNTFLKSIFYYCHYYFLIIK